MKQSTGYLAGRMDALPLYLIKSLFLMVQFVKVDSLISRSYRLVRQLSPVKHSKHSGVSQSWFKVIHARGTSGPIQYSQHVPTNLPLSILHILHMTRQFPGIFPLPYPSCCSRSFIHCKKGLAVFPSPAELSLTKLSLGRDI